MSKHRTESIYQHVEGNKETSSIVSGGITGENRLTDAAHAHGHHHKKFTDRHKLTDRFPEDKGYKGWGK